jgi:hypothetical protein
MYGWIKDGTSFGFGGTKGHLEEGPFSKKYLNFFLLSLVEALAPCQYLQFRLCMDVCTCVHSELMIYIHINLILNFLRSKLI